MNTEADEIRTARLDPRARPLRVVNASRLQDAMTTYAETTLKLSAGASYRQGRVFRAAVRELVMDENNQRRGPVPDVRLWFEDQTSKDDTTVLWTAGDIDLWDDNGEIYFTDGTRLNDRTLLRVTF